MSLFNACCTSSNLETPTRIEALPTLFLINENVQLENSRHISIAVREVPVDSDLLWYPSIVSRCKTASFHRALLVSYLPQKFHRRFLVDVCDSSMKVSGTSGKRMKYKSYVLN